MTKKISLNIPEESYEGLASLSKFYGQDMRQTITGILEAVGSHGGWMKDMSKDYPAPVKSTIVLTDMLDAATNSIGLFNEIPEKLQAKGLFMLQGFEFDLDKVSLTFSYGALKDSDLCIDSFCLWLESGIKSLRADFSLEVAKVNKKSLEKLKQLVDEFGRLEEPEEFAGLEEYHVEIEDTTEEFWNVVIHCEAERLKDFPSIKQLSRVVERILEKAGIIPKTESRTSGHVDS